MTDRMRELFEGSERQLFVNPQKDFLNEVFWELMQRFTFWDEPAGFLWLGVNFFNSLYLLLRGLSIIKIYDSQFGNSIPPIHDRPRGCSFWRMTGNPELPGRLRQNKGPPFWIQRQMMYTGSWEHDGEFDGDPSRWRSQTSSKTVSIIEVFDDETEITSANISISLLRMPCDARTKGTSFSWIFRPDKISGWNSLT
jgi:hypothetical protein